MHPSGRSVPEAVDQFLARYVTSIEYLEILLLLADNPERHFTADEVAREIYSVPQSVRPRLKKMVRDKLAEATGEAAVSVRFATVNPELVTLVAQVAQTYRERRVAVVSLIASRPMENVRAFSDAFRLGRKDKP